MRRMLATAGLGSAVLLGTAGAEALAFDPTGIWKMANGKVTVRISACGQKLCGTVVGLKKPLDKHGRPKRDKENPVQALRQRPVIGLTILNDMRPAGGGQWDGTIYNPDDGNTYTSHMVLQNADTMKVDGCVTIICKSMKFIRVQ